MSTLLTCNTDALRQDVADSIAADSIDPKILRKKYGIPLPLARIAEKIYEKLPPSEAKDFFSRIPEAVGADGRDLSRLHFIILGDVLRELLILGHARCEDSESKYLDNSLADDLANKVITGLDLMAKGERYPEPNSLRKKTVLYYETLFYGNGEGDLNIGGAIRWGAFVVADRNGDTPAARASAQVLEEACDSVAGWAYDSAYWKAAAAAVARREDRFRREADAIGAEASHSMRAQFWATWMAKFLHRVAAA